MNYVPKDIRPPTNFTNNSGFVAMRGITSATMEFYGVRTKSDADGPVAQEYVYPSGGKKIRYWPKSFSQDGLRSDELFGMNLWNAGSARYVTVTEGELDAMSAYQMLKGNYTNPVVSLPSATPSKALWEKCKAWLDSFEKIILSVDTDDAGNAIAAKMANLFPNKVYRVPHDKYKDANEFLQSGQAGAFKNAWYGAKKFVPENILNTSDQFLSLYRDTPEHQYVPTGIQALDDKIMGLMQGHFTVIKAPTGVGKTEVMRYLEYNLLQQKVPFATWHLEETKLRSLLGLVSYHMGGNVTRRDLIDEETAPLVEEAIVDLTKDENFYQFYLPDGQGADELIEQIRFFREACGCKYIFFEPIQDVVAGLTEDGKEQILADLSVRLSKLAAELNVGIVTIAHTNDNGDPKYCKMIAQRASVIINLYRDKEAESEDDRNTTYLSVEKNRPCAEVGPSGRLRFNAKTFILKELA
jgi:twinkle protein